MEMKPKEFDAFRSLVYETCGITLGEGKESLVATRIGKRMRVLGVPDFRAYLDWIGAPEGQDEIVHMLDAISTNVTHFFREPEHFKFIRETVLHWKAQGQRRFRFWSAACSSGEEPYSLAMTLAECGLAAECDVRILGTDISTRILSAAKAGGYGQAQIAALPPGYAARYLERVPDSNPPQWQIPARRKKWRYS